MSRDRYLYGVLKPNNIQEIICDATNDLETRLVLRDEEGQEFTLVTEFNGQSGSFSFSVEIENHTIIFHHGGNVYTLLEEREEQRG